MTCPPVLIYDGGGYFAFQVSDGAAAGDWG
jgi:hypothetical protein